MEILLVLVEAVVVRVVSVQVLVHQAVEHLLNLLNPLLLEQITL